MSRAAHLFFLAALALGAGGCPRAPQAPPPGDAPPCASHADCNAGATCGRLVLCVGGQCGVAPAIEVACPGTGTPVR